MSKLTNYREAMVIYDKSERDLDVATRELKEQIVFIYNRYALQKTRVSTRRWPSVNIDASLTFKVTEKWVKVKVKQHLRYGAYAEFQWKFPVDWLGADVEWIDQKITKMLEKEARDIAGREAQRKENYKAALLAEINDKMEMYNAT